MNGDEFSENPQSETRPHSSPDPSCGRDESRGRAKPYPQSNVSRCRVRISFQGSPQNGFWLFQTNTTQIYFKSLKSAESPAFGAQAGALVHLGCSLNAASLFYSWGQQPENCGLLKLECRLNFQSEASIRKFSLYTPPLTFLHFLNIFRPELRFWAARR